MTLTLTRIRLLLLLLEGEHLSEGKLCSGKEMKALVEEMRKEKLLSVISHGSRRTYYSTQPEAVRTFLAAKDERLRNLEHTLAILEAGETPRAVQAVDGGDSKITAEGTAPGFAVNVAEPIQVELNGEQITLQTSSGLFYYIHEYANFKIVKDVTVVGIENMENFRHCQRMAHLFPSKSIFVCRYPQQNKTHLIKWLKQVGNRFIYFADLDLAGIQIYLTNFFAQLGNQAELFIPSDAEQRIASGVSKRYDDQIGKFRNMQVTDPRVQPLVDMIHRYHKGYDQEGYLKIYR